MAKSNNNHLLKAKKNKNNEFYTRYKDIEEELKYYKQCFCNKSILCNCNDINSNFYKYFKNNFKLLGLNKLVATGFNSNGKAEWLECIENETELKETRYIFNGNGDFRSDEVIALLKQADVVVTNPPFSLFREFISQLMKYNKKFIVVGNKNSITYKKTFPLIMNNKMWLGVHSKGSLLFNVSDLDSDLVKSISIYWYTNLYTEEQREELKLSKMYDESAYPKYDNYDAIEVSRVVNIPKDYDGVMGVPVTFINKYNPEQFEILGITQRGCHDLVPDTKKYDDYWEMRQNGTKTGSSGNKTNENANLRKNDGVHNYFINGDGDVVQATYKRIFIRNRKPEK